MPQINFYVGGREGGRRPLPGFRHPEPGASRRVIVRSAIKTVPPLDRLTFGLVTAALCLCVFKDKRQKHLGSFLFPCFHLAGKEHGRSVVHRSWITSKLACLSRTTANLWAGQAPATRENIQSAATSEGFSCFHRSILAQKSGTYHHLPNFVSQRTSPNSLKWIITSWLQISLPLCSPFPFERSQGPLSRKDSTCPVALFCFCFLANHGWNPVKLQAPVVLPDALIYGQSDPYLWWKIQMVPKVVGFYSTSGK